MTKTVLTGEQVAELTIRQLMPFVRAPTDAGDGTDGDLSPAEPVEEGCRASDLPVSAARSFDRTFQLGVGDRHHLHPGARRCHLPVRGDRLALADGARLGLSNTLDASFCVGAVQRAMAITAHRRSSTQAKARSSPARHLPSRYETMVDAHAHLDAYFRFYNERRPPSAHGRQTPAEVYRQSQTQQAA